jgi:hypothetical protein
MRTAEYGKVTFSSFYILRNQLFPPPVLNPNVRDISISFRDTVNSEDPFTALNESDVVRHFETVIFLQLREIDTRFYVGELDFLQRSHHLTPLPPLFANHDES